MIVSHPVELNAPFCCDASCGGIVFNAGPESHMPANGVLAIQRREAILSMVTHGSRTKSLIERLIAPRQDD